jgi:hypothetical protein
MNDSETNQTTYEVWVQHTEGEKHWYPRVIGFDTIEAARQYVKEHTLNRLFVENFKIVKAERSTKFTVQT